MIDCLRGARLAAALALAALVDRNPQKYVPNIFAAEAEDFIAVTNRVYRSLQQPSRIEVAVLDGR